MSDDFNPGQKKCPLFLRVRNFNRPKLLQYNIKLCIEVNRHNIARILIRRKPFVIYRVFGEGCFSPLSWRNAKNIPFLISRRLSQYLTCSKDGRRKVFTTLFIADNNCVFVVVPANMTNYFQPLDLTVKGPAMQFLKGTFQQWYARKTTKQIDKGIDVYCIDVNTKLSVMKLIRARWLVGSYDHLRNKPEVIRKGFEMAGVVEAITKKLEPEDPFEVFVADH